MDGSDEQTAYAFSQAYEAAKLHAFTASTAREAADCLCEHLRLVAMVGNMKLLEVALGDAGSPLAVSISVAIRNSADTMDELQKSIAAQDDSDVTG